MSLSFNERRLLFKIILRDFPEFRIMLSALAILRYNFYHKSFETPQKISKNICFCLSFSKNLNDFYFAQYNKIDTIPQNFLISENLILKIGVINEDLGNVKFNDDFYKVLRNFYLANLASETELVLKPGEKQKGKHILHKKSEELSGNYKDLFDIPSFKEIKKQPLLFTKEFYRDLTLKKLGISKK